MCQAHIEKNRNKTMLKSS